MTILSEILPIVIVIATGWCAWVSKTIIDIVSCNKETKQKLEDFIDRYDEHIDK